MHTLAYRTGLYLGVTTGAGGIKPIMIVLGADQVDYCMNLYIAHVHTRLFTYACSVSKHTRFALSTQPSPTTVSKTNPYCGRAIINSSIRQTQNKKRTGTGKQCLHPKRMQCQNLTQSWENVRSYIISHLHYFISVFFVITTGRWTWVLW